MSANTSAGLMELITPLGANVLLVESLEGREGLSEPFAFRLNLLALNDANVDFRRMVGANVSISLRFPGSPQRSINGIVSTLQEGDQDDQFTSYHAVVVPRFWRLKKQVESRIFQQQSVLEVLGIVLGDIEHSFHTSRTYRRANYTVQYNESNFDFASRLMEEAGLYYYFTFTEDGHRMVIADNSMLAPALPEMSVVRFVKSTGAAVVEPGIRQWRKTQEVRAAGYSARDYTHELPNDRLESKQSARATLTVGDSEHSLNSGFNSDLSISEYPGGYAHKFDPVASGTTYNRDVLQQVFAEKQQQAQVRIEEEEAQGLYMEGSGNLQHLLPGFQFDLAGHFRSNGSFLIDAVEHHARNRSFRAENAEEGDYRNTIRCLPLESTYRTPRKTPRPRIPGPQTATVVGPSGETVHTDLHGRIKVQFHWDRQGKFNGDSSCWIRVAQQWAGKGFGFHVVPRIGHEVIVDFLNGDPDRPIAVGSVYNATNPPPHKMPDFKHRTAVKSRSVPNSPDDDVGSSNSSGILFDDTYGAEHMQMHSERHRTDSTESLHFVNAGVGHHTHVGSLHTHQVGGWKGLDHAQGPSTTNWTSTGRDNRNSLVQNSGSGAGGSSEPTSTGTATSTANNTQDFSGNYESVSVGEAALSMSTTFGLNSEIVFGNLNEFVLGQTIESYINPYQFAGALFPSNPFLAFGFSFAVGYGETLLEGALEDSQDPDSPSDSSGSTFSSYKTYQKQAPKIVKGIYKFAKSQAKKADSKHIPEDTTRNPALKKISKTQREQAAKNQPGAKDESKSAAETQQKALKDQKAAAKKLGEADDRVNSANKHLQELEDKKNKPEYKKMTPEEQQKLQQDIDKAHDEVKDADEEKTKAATDYDKTTEDVKTANQKMTERREALQKDYDEKKAAAAKAREEEKEKYKEADQKEQEGNRHQKDAESARRGAEQQTKEADRAEQAGDKKTAAAHRKNAKIYEEDAAAEEKRSKELKKQAEENRENSRKATAQAEKDEQDAHDKMVAGDVGEDAAKGDPHADNPKCGDFTGIGGYSSVYIGTYAQITNGDVFQVNRGTPQTTVSSPTADQPTAAKCMMVLYSFWQIASTVVQSLEPQNDTMAASYGTTAGMMQNTVPTLILQIWMATEYAGQITADASTSGEAVQEKAAATATGGTQVKLAGGVFMATCGRTWAKYEKYILWGLNIISAGVSTVEGVYALVSSWEQDSGSGGASPEDDDWAPVASGSGGAGFVSGALDDVIDNVVPHVVDATTGYVINTTTLQINTTPDLENDTDSLISLMAMGGDESPGQVQIYGSGTVLLQGGTMTYISLSTSDAETGSVSISCGEDGVLTLGNGAVPTNNLTISAESNILTAGENVLTHNEDGFIFEVGDTEVCITEEGIELSIGASCITMSDDSITLSAGGAALVLSSEGITLEGAIVDVTSEGDFNVTADACSVEAIGVSLG